MQEILYDLQVNHTENCPVFVLGHGRSGTSILIKLIRKYLKVNFGTESQFIVRYYKSLKNYGDIKKDDNLKRLIIDLSKERWFKRVKKRFGFEPDLTDLFLSIKERTYRGVLDAIFEQFATYHGMERWGDKTPEYIYDLPVLNKLFPEAKYIHIVRDGRDVALSEFKTQFGAKNIYKAAEEWKRKVGLIHEFGSLLPAERYCEIRYEDFLSRPSDVFQKLISFLKIANDDQVVQFIEKNISSDLKRGNFYKWKNELDRSQRRIFEREAGDFLRYYNYENEYNLLPKIKNLEKAIWELDNFVRRKFRINFWQDNLYRLNIRFHHFFSAFRKHKTSNTKIELSQQ